MEQGLYDLKKQYDEDIIIMNTREVFHEELRDVFRDNTHFLDYANDIVSTKFLKSIDKN